MKKYIPPTKLSPLLQHGYYYLLHYMVNNFKIIVARHSKACVLCKKFLNPAKSVTILMYCALFSLITQFPTKIGCIQIIVILNLLIGIIR